MKDQCCIDASIRMLGIWKERIHKKIDANKVGLNTSGAQKDLKYWEGFNAGLEWAHRIVDGDKSAD